MSLQITGAKYVIIIESVFVYYYSSLIFKYFINTSTITFIYNISMISLLAFFLSFVGIFFLLLCIIINLINLTSKNKC